jgi:anti-sigma factor RsiW
MTQPERPVTEDDLHAYVDQRLDAHRRAAVADHLAADPEAATRVAAYAAQRAGLRAALAGRAAEPVPARLDLGVILRQRQQQRRAWWRVAAAAVLALGVGGSAGWIGHAVLRSRPTVLTVLMQEAVANHVVYSSDRRRPTELGADQRDDLARWVSNRLHLPVTPPDLTADGFRFIGGRLAATPEGPAGLFMYQNAAGLRLTVFVRPVASAKPVPMSRVQAEQLGGCAWIQHGVGYSVISDMPEDALDRIAIQVQRQVEGPV